MGLLKTKSSLGLKLADVAWSTAVLAPLVVTYWRGTWDLLDDLVSWKFEIFQGSGGFHIHFSSPGVSGPCQGAELR